MPKTNVAGSEKGLNWHSPTGPRFGLNGSTVEPWNVVGHMGVERDVLRKGYIMMLKVRKWLKRGLT